MRGFARAHSVLLSCALGTAACGGSEDTAPAGGAGGTTGTGGGSTTGSTTQDGAAELRGPCALPDKIGYFDVQHETDYSTVVGEILDGVVPSTVLNNVGEEGDCVLWQRVNPFCDPPCPPGDTCDHGGTCIPYPQPMTVGTVSVSGLEKPVSMQPPTYFDTTMPHPAFLPGAAITLTASGGDYAGFTTYGEGFAPIIVPNASWVITEGEPLAMAWTADDSSPHALVQLRLNIDQHGNSPVEIVCEVADNGAYSIPATLIDALLGFGVTGFPSGNVTRHTVDSVPVGPGCVQFEVFSHLQGELQVSGHIPCTGPKDCPAPMTCDLPTQTCVG